MSYVLSCSKPTGSSVVNYLFLFIHRIVYNAICQRLEKNDALLFKNIHVVQMLSMVNLFIVISWAPFYCSAGWE